MKSDYDIEVIASEYLDRVIPSYKETIGKQKLSDCINQNFEKLNYYIMECAYVVLQAGIEIENKLDK